MIADNLLFAGVLVLIFIWAMYRNNRPKPTCFDCGGRPATTPNCRACVGLKISRELHGENQ